MTTLAPDNLRTLATTIEDVPDLPSATNSGIVGNLAHERRGYHTSIEDLADSNDYSNVRPNDKAPPGNWPRNLASAVDTSMSTEDMVKAWNRIYAVWANQADPRRKYFNAVNGWNGTGDAERLDFVANTRTTASSDHQWHTHDETPRRYANDPEAARAKASVYRGESVAQYLGTTTTTMGDDMQVIELRKASGSAWFITNGVQYRSLDTWPAVLTWRSITGRTDTIVTSDADMGVIAGVPYSKASTTPVVLTDADKASIAEMLAALVIADTDNELTADDLTHVKDAMKAAVRELVAPTA